MLAAPAAQLLSLHADLSSVRLTFSSKDALVHFLMLSMYCILGRPLLLFPDIIPRMQVFTRLHLYWNGQLVWTPALSTLFVGVCIQRELSPTSGYTGISARRRYAMFFYLQSVPTRSLSTLVG